MTDLPEGAGISEAAVLVLWLRIWLLVGLTTPKAELVDPEISSERMDDKCVDNDAW